MKYGEHDRIKGGAQNERSTRVACLSRPFQQSTSCPKIAFGHQLLATPDQILDLPTIKLRLAGERNCIRLAWRSSCHMIFGGAASGRGVVLRCYGSATSRS